MKRLVSQTIRPDSSTHKYFQSDVLFNNNEGEPQNDDRTTDNGSEAQGDSNLDEPSIVNNQSDAEENLFTMEGARTRIGRRVRARDISALSFCYCDYPVDNVEIEAGQDVICCKRKGCSTKWVRFRQL
jgi:hypothetical protein